MHYQRVRREGEQETGTVGRPRIYPKEKGKSHRGAPQMTVRLEPEVMDWVKENGGAGFLRKLTERLYELVQNEEFQDAWDQISPD